MSVCMEVAYVCILCMYVCVVCMDVAMLCVYVCVPCMYAGCVMIGCVYYVVFVVLRVCYVCM